MVQFWKIESSFPILLLGQSLKYWNMYKLSLTVQYQRRPPKLLKIMVFQWTFWLSRIYKTVFRTVFSIRFLSKPLRLELKPIPNSGQKRYFDFLEDVYFPTLQKNVRREAGCLQLITTAPSQVQSRFWRKYCFLKKMTISASGQSVFRISVFKKIGLEANPEHRQKEHMVILKKSYFLVLPYRNILQEYINVLGHGRWRPNGIIWPPVSVYWLL